MIEITLNGSMTYTVYGLTQWDYGQYLKFSGTPDLDDGVEVQFYQRTLAGTTYIKDNMCKVPDKLLENPSNIIAYVYVKSEGEGETILTLFFKVQKRPKPEDYELPDHDDSNVSYETLNNKPMINGVTLSGDKTLEDLGEQTMTNSELCDIVNYHYNLIFGDE